MSDLEIIFRLLLHCGPWMAAVVTVAAVVNRAYERYEFRKYENRRRKYSEWRLRHLDEIQ